MVFDPDKFLAEEDPKEKQPSNFDPDAFLANEPTNTYSAPIEIQEDPTVIESLLRGGAQGATFGFADEIQAAIQAGLDKEKTYEDFIGDVREKYRVASEVNPIASTIGNVGGSIATSAFVPGLGVGKLAQGATVGQKMLQGAKVGALWGGLEGLGRSEKEGVGENLTEAAKGAAFGGAIGGITPYAMDRAGKALKAIDETAEKLSLYRGLKQGWIQRGKGFDSTLPEGQLVEDISKKLDDDILKPATKQLKNSINKIDNTIQKNADNITEIFEDTVKKTSQNLSQIKDEVFEPNKVLSFLDDIDNQVRSTKNYTEAQSNFIQKIKNSVTDPMKTSDDILSDVKSHLSNFTEIDPSYKKKFLDQFDSLYKRMGDDVLLNKNELLSKFKTPEIQDLVNKTLSEIPEGQATLKDLLTVANRESFKSVSIYDQYKELLKMNNLNSAEAKRKLVNSLKNQGNTAEKTFNFVDQLNEISFNQNKSISKEALQTLAEKRKEASQLLKAFSPKEQRLITEHSKKLLETDASTMDKTLAEIKKYFPDMNKKELLETFKDLQSKYSLSGDIDARSKFGLVGEGASKFSSLARGGVERAKTAIQSGQDIAKQLPFVEKTLQTINQKAAKGLTPEAKFSDKYVRDMIDTLSKRKKSVAAFKAATNPALRKGLFNEDEE